MYSTQGQFFERIINYWRCINSRESLTKLSRNRDSQGEKLVPRLRFNLKSEAYSSRCDARELRGTRLKEREREREANAKNLNGKKIRGEFVRDLVSLFKTRPR